MLLIVLMRNMSQRQQRHRVLMIVESQSITIPMNEERSMKPLRSDEKEISTCMCVDFVQSCALDLNEHDSLSHNIHIVSNR